jgi:large repetitive protein
MSEHPTRRTCQATPAGTAVLSASWWRGHRGASALLFFVGFALIMLWPAHSDRAGAAPPTYSSITVEAHDLQTGNPLSQFTFIVNVDNSGDPSSPDPMKRPSAGTESYSPLVATGDQDNATVKLQDGLKYLISIRSPDHAMWGKHITLPADAGTVRIDLHEASAVNPLPTGKIRFFVFNDNRWTNGAPDAEEILPGTGMGGFHVTLEEQTNSQVSVDYHNRPLCGGDCVTANDGFVQINDLSPATYFIYVTPPSGPCNSDPNSFWTQTVTFDGGLGQQAGIEPGSDGSGAPGELLWEPANRRTGYFAGFVCVPQDFPRPGTGSITGRALNWQGWPPFDQLTLQQDEPVQQPFVALTDSATDTTVWVGRGDADGNFNIPNVPAGTYTMTIWDEQLNYILRFIPVTVGNGQNVDVGDVGVSRWFGWLDGTVYQDLNGNGVYDQGIDKPIPNTDVDQRWRDGSIKDATTTDANGYYQYPMGEGGPLGKWIINEQGFSRMSAYPGPSVHDEHTGVATPLPTDLGGGLLSNQLLTEGHRATVDWGKRAYGNEPGQIVGITYFATTRNEMDARMQAHEDYEPAIPNVEVRLEAQDGSILNNYITDKWSQPSKEPDPTLQQNCNPIRGADGSPVTGLNPTIGDNCLEVPINGQQSKDGAFDGGYAFNSYCPGPTPVATGGPTGQGLDVAHFNQTGESLCLPGDTDPVPLIAGTYVTHVIMPKNPDDTRPCNPNPADPATLGFKNVSDDPLNPNQEGCLFRIVKEEDVNVDLGAAFQPAIPPPPCAGDMHTVDQATITARSEFYTGDQSTSPTRPLCDKRLIVLQNKQNANADFFLMTNFPATVQNTGPNCLNCDPNHPDPVGDVAEPGRLIGLVSDDIYFDRNPQSIWYGEPRPVANIPIGIRDQNWRLIETVNTDVNGAYEALLPSTETFNCPIPQGPCPGMYIVVVNDPGDKGHPNPNYSPNYLTASLAWDVWPGQTDQLDTPLDPISGTGCDLSLGPGGTPSGIPELLQVRKVTDTAGNTNRVASEQGPFVRATDTGSNRRIAIDADFIGTAGPTGATGGHINLTDQATGAVTTLTRANGGILSWTPGSTTTADRIVLQVPGVSTSFTAGPKQLTIVTSNANGGLSSTSSITLHVLGTGYNPTVVKVGTPASSPHALQNAIDGATAGSLLVLSPGVYNENIVLYKRLIIQGLGPGGIIGAHELNTKSPDDPRFNIPGSVIDGRFFHDNEAAWDATVNSIGTIVGVDGSHPVLRGADITVVAPSTSTFTNSQQSARIDGVGLQLGHGDGAGGIQLQDSVNNFRITNNILESNGGVFAGGIGVGQPFTNSQNTNVKILNDRVEGNGGLSKSGGIGLFNGSNGYEIARSIVCGNFGVEYGSGISHWGLSPGGSIHDNQIYYNEAVDSGAGISIQQEAPGPNTPTPVPNNGIGQGSGAVNIDRNLIQSNMTFDDGGGIFVLDSLTQPVNIRNNQIVDNGAADMGGAIALRDASNVAIVNNTVANNVTTGTSGTSDLVHPHSAGLASEVNDPRFQALQSANAPHFSNPVALFNNIFYNNQAFLLDQFGPGASLVSQGFIDFEVHGTCDAFNPSPNCAADRFTPRYSIVTNGQILGPDSNMHPLQANQGNIVGADPGFVNPFTLELTVAGSRLDPQTASVTITGADPPVGLTGDYHLLTSSAAIDRGVRCALTPFPAPVNATSPCTATPPAGGRGIQAPTGTPSTANPGGGDYDSQARPQLRSTRTRTPWDLGADEVAGFPVSLP